jgi:hypothetical protein
MEFRFDAGAHEYIELATGVVRPHITGMLLRTGWVDDTFFTEEGSARGTAIHDATAQYDMGSLVPGDYHDMRYRGYLLSHVRAMEIAQPEFYDIEMPFMHEHYLYGGRPDRVGKVYGQEAVLEGKSGGPAKSHQIQTALQAILVAAKLKLPPHAVGRFALYWKANGKFTLLEHTRRQDFDEAYRVIKVCCE